MYSKSFLFTKPFCNFSSDTACIFLHFPLTPEYSTQVQHLKTTASFISFIWILLLSKRIKGFCLFVRLLNNLCVPRKYIRIVLVWYLSFSTLSYCIYTVRPTWLHCNLQLSKPSYGTDIQICKIQVTCAQKLYWQHQQSYTMWPTWLHCKMQLSETLYEMYIQICKIQVTCT